MLADILLRSTIYLRQLSYGTCKSETSLSRKELYTKQKELRIGSSSWCHQESNRGHKARLALPVLCSNQTKTPRRRTARRFNVVPPGIEPGTQGFSVLCSTNWAMAPANLIFKVVPPGIEPGTQGFSVLCSTNWAMAPWRFAVQK